MLSNYEILCFVLLQKNNKTMTVIYLLIGLNILISIKGFEDRLFFHRFLFHVGAIRSGDQIRMLSSAFLHADYAHLAFNMIALYSFAPVVLGEFGVFTFLLIYGASLLFGNMLSLWMHKDNSSYTAVGASGAVTGIIYSAILLNPQGKVYLFFIPIGIPSFLFGIFYLLYTLYGMRTRNDAVGHDAHFGGALGGMLFTLLKFPQLIQINPLLIIGLLIPIVLLVVFMRQGKL